MAVLEVVVPVVVVHLVVAHQVPLRQLNLTANPTSICLLVQYGLARPVDTLAFLSLPAVEVA